MKKEVITKSIRVGAASIQALCMPLLEKNLIVLRGAKGYVMCGYLNMTAANTFNEVAVKITGVATINQALAARVCACSRAAHKLGIRKDQPIKEVLKLIA